ncbi:hypothetical protein ACQ4PT_067428 [Festuca glaucescens]
MDKHAQYFAEAREICEQLGLIPLMEFHHPYNVDIIDQFYATVYVDNDDAKTMTWLTEGRMLHGTWEQFANCLGYPVLPANSEGYFRAHYTPKPLAKELLADLYLPGEVVYGSQKYLLPVYDILLRICREVLNPKVGCVDQIYGYLVNLLYLTHQHRGTHLQLDVMEYLWEEFWTCIIPRKSPVFAPYFMRFICSRWDNARLDPHVPGDSDDDDGSGARPARPLGLGRGPAPQGGLHHVARGGHGRLLALVPRLAALLQEGFTAPSQIAPAELALSWVLLDPASGHAVNASSCQPVSVDRSWLTGETVAREGTPLCSEGCREEQMQLDAVRARQAARRLRQYASGTEAPRGHQESRKVSVISLPAKPMAA